MSATKKEETTKSKNIHWFWILLIGSLIIFILPVLFISLNLFGINFSESGEIGDTIGGISTPFISLLGAILVYMSFQKQVEANEKIQKQIESSQLERNFEFLTKEIEILTQQNLKIIEDEGKDYIFQIHNLEALLRKWSDSLEERDIPTIEGIKIDVKHSLNKVAKYANEIKKISEFETILFLVDTSPEQRMITLVKTSHLLRFLNKLYLEKAYHVNNDIINLSEGFRNETLGLDILIMFGKMQVNLNNIEKYSIIFGNTDLIVQSKSPV